METDRQTLREFKCSSGLKMFSPIAKDPGKPHSMHDKPSFESFVRVTPRDSQNIKPVFIDTGCPQRWKVTSYYQRLHVFQTQHAEDFELKEI